MAGLPEKGERAPEFSVGAHDGTTITLEQFRDYELPDPAPRRMQVALYGRS